MPHLLFSFSSLLLPHAASALLLGTLGGYQLARGDAPLLVAALAVSSIGVLLHGAWSLQRRLQRAIDQSAQALRDLGEGRTGFRLSADGLPGFDPLLLAIDDLREVVEPSFHRVERHHEAGLGLTSRTPAVSPRHA